MATTMGSGSQSPPSLSRTIERVFEDARHTGEVLLSNRKLKDYPKISTKYDLVDTISADLSKNRLSEVPREICNYPSVEKINCYHNIIRVIPDAIVQLQALTYINLCRNQLTNLPPNLCQLQMLEVLLASNNKLVSLPEEIGQLERLMDLDVSCNEISHLPLQIGDLKSLRSLNLRKNLLVELPVEISKLNLRRLDFSCNKISTIPSVFRKMDSLEEIILDHNPLQLPPAQLCTKGKQHIMKYLLLEAIKEDKKRGILSETEMRRYRKSLPLHQPSEDWRNLMNSPEMQWKRHTVISNDSGYSTTDSTEKMAWVPEASDGEDVVTLRMKAAEAVKEHRHGREMNHPRTAILDPPWQQIPEENQDKYNQNTNSDSVSQTSPHNQIVPYTGQETVKQSPQSSALMNHNIAMTISRIPINNQGIHSPETPRSSHMNNQIYSQANYSHDTTRMPQTLPSSPVTSPPSFNHEMRHSKPSSPLVSANHQNVNSKPSVSSPSTPGSLSSQVDSNVHEDTDEFTKELQRQRSEYDRRKKLAEQLRLQQEDEEREERRQAAIKIQEEQRLLMEKQRDELRLQEELKQREDAQQKEFQKDVADGKENSTDITQPVQNSPDEQPKTPKAETNYSVYYPYHMHGEQSLGYNDQYWERAYSPVDNRKSPASTSQSIKEDKKTYSSTSQYRRTQSDSKFTRAQPQHARHANHSYKNGITDETTPNTSAPSPSPGPNRRRTTPINSPTTPSPASSTSSIHKIQGTERLANHSPATRRATKFSERSSTTTTRTTTTDRHGRTTTTSTSSTTSRIATTRKNQNHVTPEEEFRQRHQQIKNHTQTESQLLKKRLEDQMVKASHKDVKSKNSVTKSSSTSTKRIPETDNKKATSRTATRNIANTSSTTRGGRTGLSQQSIKLLEEYKDSNPNFTIRRQHEQTKGELEYMSVLRQTIETRLKVQLPDNLTEALRDGVVLCHLANQIRPRSVTSIHVPSPAVPKLTMAKCRKNVENFLEACRKIGVDQEHICSSPDILEEKGVSKIAITIAALIAIATNPKQSAV